MTNVRVFLACLAVVMGLAGVGLFLWGMDQVKDRPAFLGLVILSFIMGCLFSAVIFLLLMAIRDLGTRRTEKTVFREVDVQPSAVNGLMGQAMNGAQKVVNYPIAGLPPGYSQGYAFPQWPTGQGYAQPQNGQPYSQQPPARQWDNLG